MRPIALLSHVQDEEKTKKKKVEKSKEKFEKKKREESWKKERKNEKMPQKVYSSRDVQKKCFFF